MTKTDTLKGSLVPHHLYRLHHLMDDRNLRGRAVTFYELRVFTQGDIPRCRVRLLNEDGTSGEEYLVNRSCIIAF